MHVTVAMLLGEEQLSEFSLNTLFLGYDPDVLDDIEFRMQGDVTVAEKKAAVAEMDELIRQNRRTFTWPTVSKGLMTKFIPEDSLLGAMVQINQAKDRGEQREMLKALRKLVTSVKTIDGHHSNSHKHTEHTK